MVMLSSHDIAEMNFVYEFQTLMQLKQSIVTQLLANVNIPGLQNLVTDIIENSFKIKANKTISNKRSMESF